MKTMPTSEWALYMLSGVTRNGHTLAEVLAYDDTRFDLEHGFIQWVLPNREPSKVNVDAPVLLDQDIELYHQSEQLRLACSRVAVRFLKSLGISQVETSPLLLDSGGSTSECLIKSVDFDKLSRQWLCAHSHHHLRITRFLNFNMAMGNYSQCEQLLEFIRNEIISIKEQPSISLKYWEDSIRVNY